MAMYKILWRTRMVTRHKQIRILSYNTKMMILDKTAKQRAEMMLEHFVGYDIVCLQELFDEERREQIEDSLSKNYGLENRTEGPYADWMAGQFVGGGLAICTHYDIIRCSSLKFGVEETVGSDALAAKGVSHALIAFDTKRSIHVFTAHLQSGSTTKRTDARWRQLRNTAEFIFQEIEGDEYPAILVGDLNVNATVDKDYYRLMSILVENVSVRMVKDMGQREVTFERGSQSLDYAILFEKKDEIEYSVEVKRGWHSSDHEALQITLDL